jgi:uncharacterized protein YbaR (Trm112 family)
LIQRTFGLDVLACPRCGGRLRLVALIEQASVVQRILRHLGLPTEVPELRPPGRRPGDSRHSTINPGTLPNSMPPAESVASREEGASRPDVGAAFGETRFGASGYRLDVSGLTTATTYDVVVFAHSTISGTFNQYRVIRVTVQ